MGEVSCAEHEKLIGKHVRPCVGQLVVMSQQGLVRRREAGRSDPSRGGLGKIVRVNPNWTCGKIKSNPSYFDRCSSIVLPGLNVLMLFDVFFDSQMCIGRKQIKLEKAMRAGLSVLEERREHSIWLHSHPMRSFRNQLSQATTDSTALINPSPSTRSGRCSLPIPPSDFYCRLHLPTS